MTVSAAVIGAGRMGRIHVRALRACGVPVVGLADSDPVRLHESETSLGDEAARTFVDATEMLAQTRPELVCIATTTPGRESLFATVTQFGPKYILAEKPLSGSIRGAESFISECADRGIRLAVNHQSRFLQRYVDIQIRAESAEFGRLRSMTVSGSDFGLAMNGVHFIEVFEWLMRERIEVVCARVAEDRNPNPRGSAFVDYAGSFLGWTSSGARLFLDCSDDVGHGISISYLFTYGRVVVDEISGAFSTVRRSGPDRELPMTRYGTSTVEESGIWIGEDLIAGASRVIKALLAGDGYPTGEDGLHAIRVVAGAIESTESGGAAIQVADASATRVFQWA